MRCANHARSRGDWPPSPAWTQVLLGRSLVDILCLAPLSMWQCIALCLHNQIDRVIAGKVLMFRNGLIPNKSQTPAPHSSGGVSPRALKARLAGLQAFQDDGTGVWAYNCLLWAGNRGGTLVMMWLLALRMGISFNLANPTTNTQQRRTPLTAIARWGALRRARRTRTR